MQHISIRQYLENPIVSSCNNFYDWFCKDTALVAKQAKLDKLVRQIATSDKINQDTMYVFYKNNCPVNGGTYDSLSICDIATGDVLYWITPRNGHANSGHKAELCGPENGFQEPLVAGTWTQIKNYFFQK